jgi:hypothetical protein
MKADDIRDELIKKGLSEQAVKGLSKKELETMLEVANESEKILGSTIKETITVDQVVESVSDLDKPVELPKPTDKNWTQYVMTLFDESELMNGMPRVDGLRRVTELVLGPFDTLTNIIEPPTINNSFRATVLVRLQFKNDKRVVDGSADVFSGNTDKSFAIHPVATAETRAEGRALRKALKLVKIVAAEEIADVDQDEPDGTDKRITSSMVTSLILMCNRQNIDLLKLAIKMGFDIQTPDDLTHAQGIQISDKLGLYQQNKEQIPQEIKKV